MNTTVQYIIILLPVLLFSMSIHEMMHAFTADWLGDPTARLMGRISLNPLRHIDPVMTIALPVLALLVGLPPIGAAKPVQVNFNHLKYGEFGGAVVGVIGPLTNLVLALLGAILFKNLNPAYGALAYKVLGMAVLVNLTFFLFNMIPWPPLDGSRLLYAFAPEPLQELMQSIERTGMMSIFIFWVLFWIVLSGPFSHLITGLMNHLAPGFLQFAGL